MMHRILLVAVGLSAIGCVHAHGGIYNYTIGGVNYTGYTVPVSP
jgi:hypothetical protein